MAAPGTYINHTVSIPLPRDEVARRLQMSLSGNSGNYFDGFTTRGDGATFINIERKYVPQWAFVGGIIGIPFLLTGLLLWLVRTTETAQITLKDAPGGCEFQIIGTTSPAIADQINMVLSGMLH